MRGRLALRGGRVGAVDVVAALDLVGALLFYLAPALALPAAVAAGYGESWWPYLATAGAAAAAGYGLRSLPGTRHVGAREAFLVIALVWLLVPAFGALPYLFSGEPQLARFVDAYFESVSGFTATGASVLTDIEALDRSLLMYRQFTQWLGGMGIVVLAIALLPRLRVGGRQLLQTELAGPTELERLTTSIRVTARRLWVLYVALTVALALGLAALGWSGADPAMGLYEAIGHAFTTVAIGGFSTEAESLAAFAAASQWLVTAFVVIAGINFLRLYRAIVQRHPSAVARDDEFRLYLAFVVVGSGLLLLELTTGGLFAGEEAVRHAVVQAASIMTTAGFASADYTQWSALAEMTLLLLMFVGASAGSTGGAIKVVRHLLIARLLRRELVQAVHRDAVVPIRLSGRVVDERALRSVVAFVVLYLGVFAVATVLLVIDARRGPVEVASFEALGAAAASLGNVGPAFGFAGPFGSYEPFSDLSTAVLTVLMWLGRLEIVPVAVLLTRAYWRA